MAEEGTVAAETIDSIVQMQYQMTVKLRPRSEKIRECILNILSTCSFRLTMNDNGINHCIKTDILNLELIQLFTISRNYWNHNNGSTILNLH
jgi:hypothetical protein